MNTYSSLQFSRSCLLIIFLCIGAISGVVCGGASDQHEDLVVTATSTVDYKTETEEQGHQKTATTVVISRDPNRETPVSVPTNKPEISDESKAHRRQNVRWLVSITSVLILVLAGWIWLDSTEEDNDLSAIGKGENIVVQVHDPG